MIQFAHDVAAHPVDWAGGPGWFLGMTVMWTLILALYVRSDIRH